MEDSEIIALYHRRDEAAIAETELKHGPFCRRVAMNILSNRQDAEECVNDAWLAAWNRMPPDRPASLRAFLGRITRNLSISRFRKNRAQKRYSGIETMLSELSECVPAGREDDEIERRELSGTISEWLCGLDADDRTLFVRRYWYGDGVAELARERGVPPARLSKRLQRLREGLREVLEREGF